MTKQIRIRSDEYKRKQLEKQNERRRADPEKYKAMGRRSEHRRRLHKYGLTESQYEEMFIDQQGKCKICECTLLGGRNTVVDHCHRTEFVRGILCNHCNIMLGHAKDNPNILDKAIKYLKGNL